VVAQFTWTEVVVASERYGALVNCGSAPGRSACAGAANDSAAPTPSARASTARRVFVVSEPLYFLVGEPLKAKLMFFSPFSI
jgi:hypothetical protein